MKLSIITVNLNNRAGLQKTGDSVITQSFKDFEWIVIDGGSSDGSRELIEQYSDYIAYWVSEPDKGVYNAMNKGVTVAKGEYLQFLNSGDWLYDNTALERCFSHRFAADIVYGDLYFCRGDEKKPYVYPDRLSSRFMYDYSLGHNATFIKREALIEEPYDESLKIVSDWKFFLIQGLENKKFEHLKEFVTCFDESGISSVNAQLVAAEREKVRNERFPQMVIEDLRGIEVMETKLNDNLVKGVMEYGNKKKFYRKLMNGCLRFVKLLDRVG